MMAALKMRMEGVVLSFVIKHSYGKGKRRFARHFGGRKRWLAAVLFLRQIYGNGIKFWRNMDKEKRSRGKLRVKRLEFFVGLG